MNHRSSSSSRRRWAAAVALALLLASAAPRAAALRFIVVPLATSSPAMDLMATAAQLAARGHAVTVAAPAAELEFFKKAAARHSSNTTAELGLRYISYRTAGSLESQLSAAATSDAQAVLKRGGGLAALKLVVMLQRLLSMPCGSLLSDNATMSHLRALQADAVMAIGLPIASSKDDCGCVLSHALGVPAVVVNGNPLFKGPPGVPQFGSGLTQQDLATLAGRAKNSLAWAAKSVVPDVLMELLPGNNPWGELRAAAGLPSATSGCFVANALAAARGRKSRKCQAAVEVILNSWLLESPRPLQPYQVLVGPGSPRPPHPISPPELAAFFDAATSDGLVLVAFGTTIQASLMMSADDYRELAHAFASLAPTRVLWTLKAKNLPAGLSLEQLPLGPNTKVVPWADYNDVLGHPATRVVVTHCGIHSMHEAAFHGVPVAAIPFQFEQAENCAKLIARGMGLPLHEAVAYRQGKGAVSSFSRGAVAATLQQLLQDPGYASAATAMSEALQTYAKRRHPYERAADEIELALHALHAQQQQSARPAAARPTAADGERAEL